METIVHVIDSLGSGGAENLLKGAIPALPHYHHLIVYLYESEGDECFLEGYPKVYLNFGKKTTFLKVVLNLREIVLQHKASIVHSHLYWSTIISRFAVPKRVKLISTYHSLLYDKRNKAQYSKKMLWLDKITYSRRLCVLFVSEEVKKLVSEKVGIRRNSYVLYNYVEDIFFDQQKSLQCSLKDKIKVVAVGNLRPEKNYKLLIEAFSRINSPRIELCIYGSGKLEHALHRQVQLLKARNVVFKGHVDQLEKVLVDYDLFLSGSNF